MTTKVYDAAFHVSVSPEQFAGIRIRYEQLRKTELYRGPRIRKVFQTQDALEGLKDLVQSETSLGEPFTLRLTINFPRAAEEEGEVRWREYGTTLIRLIGALDKKRVPIRFELSPVSAEKTLGWKVSSKVSIASDGTEKEGIDRGGEVLRYL